MVPHHSSSSMEIFPSNEFGHSPPIAIFSSSDLETVRSHSKITPNTSMNSLSTQWSTATIPASNTTRHNSERKRRKRNFVHFVKLLMGIVKEKDDERFRSANAVMCDWKQQKCHGGMENFTETLKQAVGPQFWSEARERMSQASELTKSKSSSFGTKKESGVDSSDTTALPQYQKDSSYLRSRMTQIPKPKRNTGNDMTIDEARVARIRKKRRWIVIRVFLKGLHTKHEHLYRKAHALVNDCRQEHIRCRQNKNRDSLSRSIEARLKQEFGPDLWMRAEQLVSESGLFRQEDR